MDMEYVYWERRSDHPQVAQIVLNREEVLNAFNTAMAEQLIEVCHELRELKDVRVVGVRSSNSKAFCTGADLKERNSLDDDQWLEQHRIFQNMFNSLAKLPMPTIAVIDGYALAGGMELALNCDFWIVSNRSILGLPEASRGIMPGGGSTRLLAKRIGIHRAKEIILTGRKFTAEEINSMGLCNRLVAPDEIDREFITLAETISHNAPLAVQLCKTAIDELFTLPERDARLREIEFYNQCIATEDRYEGIRAFNEKRDPHFVGA